MPSARVEGLLRRGEATARDALQRAVIEGDAWRLSGRRTLDDGQSFNIHIDPQEAGGTVHVEAPAILPDETADITIIHNATVANLADDLTVHNQRYDVPTESLETVVQRVPDGDVSGGSVTEQSRVTDTNQLPKTGGEEARAIWRTVPVGETLTLQITDDSGGNDNVFSFVLTFYEGPSLPD